MVNDIPLHIQQAADSLHKNGFHSSVFMNVTEACSAVLDYIGLDSVGIGGSMTIQELDLHSLIKASGNEVYWHWMASNEESGAVCKNAADADLYLASSNAITLDGKIVNIDGRANRVAPMIYGPKRTLIIVGRNKIAKDTQTAIERIKKEACPKNARRLKLSTPCAKTGVCTDCDSPDRICRATVILERPPFGKEIAVFIINENLGY